MRPDEQDAGDTLQHLVSSLNDSQPEHAWGLNDANGSSTTGASAESRTSSQTARPPRYSPNASSIFSSGPSESTNPPRTSDSTHRSPLVRPTVSPNGSSSAPLATLSNVTTSSHRRTARFDDDATSMVSSSQIAQVQKDADDPTTPPDSSRPSEAREYTTPRTLTRLLGAEMATSPDTSRHPSYNGPPVGQLMTRSLVNETASLPDHLYTKGLLGGRHSDIAIIAFGHQYNLHRIILDRAPFFSTALSEPWLESTAKEVPLHPEEIDSNITQTAFELALKRLYGCGVAEEEDAEAI
ncbi:hypothetical protein LTS18_010177, partial [Coniosporium uncinatum]